MLKITHIDNNCHLIDKIQKGDYLVKINREAVQDILDYYYLQADDELELEFSRKNETFVINIEKPPYEDLGLNFPPLKPRNCVNNCIFCFVDQFPAGARKGVQVKDEDYRFSFMHGNYITLSNLRKVDIERIIKYHLSPLYISVHSMNPEIRNRMLGRTKDDGFFGKFEALLEAGIELHTQVVIVPDWNDGEALKETIDKLSQYAPNMASIGLVPVGLTKHRQNLTSIRGLTPQEACNVIALSEEYRPLFQKRFQSSLLYCADEMFLLAGKPIPPDNYYDEYPQIENGVGMVRSFLEDIQEEREFFPREVKPARKLLVVTGVAFAPIMRENVIPVLNSIKGLESELITVENNFFGETVTVAGLLTGSDIIDALQDKNGDFVVLPPECLNIDGLFLNDLKIEDFINTINIKVLEIGKSFQEIFELL